MSGRLFTRKNDRWRAQMVVHWEIPVRKWSFRANKRSFLLVNGRIAYKWSVPENDRSRA
jgi:hypothetical protein